MISPSVETRSWRKVRSATPGTTTRTSAATALKSLEGSDVASSPAKSAGSAHGNIQKASQSVCGFHAPPPPFGVTRLLHSPSQGLCCSKDCELKAAGQLCDEETDCQRESVCSGVSPLCPEPSPKENLTVCGQGTRVCLHGVRRPHPARNTVQYPLPNNPATFASLQQCCKDVPIEKIFILDLRH